ncbi:GNAT family N-acetyltransferase [Spirosoma sp. HMF3257]|uniref:GNAT family N-acetyltransferase n=1 Tax=Spirosoma telluris TaxID=2183553 RepID=A0A327NJX6_9BACT|nr:GNAT family N-acetyltransferase [Spirosoma telluris]RAI75093.1 GNAT family N-acetyltransferase [Spirosoma telluris]
MKHILDNPAWHALISGNKALANGSETAKYFKPEVSPFAAVAEPTQANLELLHQTIPFATPIVLISDQVLSITAPWTVLHRLDGFQMVYDKPAEQSSTGPTVIPLTEQHVPQMLSLTALTAPGPFASKTIDFGHYEGIFDGEALIAMTGQRLHAYEFAEISAVCTHPDYLGKGYARHLIIRQLCRIQAASGTPYLHVRSDNVRAVNVYKSMGFEIRKEIYFYILQSAV